MGIKIGRIVKEFVFRSLVDQETEIAVHGHQKKISCKLKDVEKEALVLQMLEGEQETFSEEEPLRVYFFFQNSFHTFDSTLIESAEGLLKIKHPEGIYKNPQRKYERIKPQEQVQVSFPMKGKQVQLNFPKLAGPSFLGALPPPERINLASVQHLLKTFREKMGEQVSENRITILRNKELETYEEQILAALAKILWIPSTQEDFLLEDPFTDQRLIIKEELVKYGQSSDLPASVVTSKLANLLYQKRKKKIFSEVFCPLLYDEYLIGYIYCANLDPKKERISADLVDYIYQFSKVLTYALKQSGYFAKGSGEKDHVEAQIIDLSASGLLFAYPRGELDQELLLQTDLDLTIKFQDRRMTVGSRIRRKITNSRRSYYGVQFLKIRPADFHYLYEKLYGRPYDSDAEDKWEGGTPPPPLDLFRK